jgi:hypothetical protein
MEMKIWRLLFWPLILLYLTGSTLAAVLEVPTNYTTIQGAIDAAAPGDTVLVLPDTYYENISFRGKSLVVASQYLLTPDPDLIRQTVIDGGFPDQPDTGSVVVFTGGEDAATLLYGLTLTNGLGTVVPGSYAGGGILIGPGSSPTIMYNLVQNNSAVKGGGLAVRGGNPHLTRNVFVGNSAQTGGGLLLENADAVVTHNVCFGNNASGNGGALFTVTSTVQFAAGRHLWQSLPSTGVCRGRKFRLCPSLQFVLDRCRCRSTDGISAGWQAYRFGRFRSRLSARGSQ